jgi:HSP20 family protein
MTLVRRPTPFPEIVSLRDAMDRLSDERLFRPLWFEGERELMPPLDLYTTPEAVVAKMALPGVKLEDITISVTDELVTVTGSFKEETETTELGYVHRELHRGDFRRAFVPPVAIKRDEAAATFKDGLLILTLPKKAEVQPFHPKVEPT